MEDSPQITSIFSIYHLWRVSHLYASFRQVNGESQPLSHADVWVLGLLEGFLQRLQL